MWTLDEIIDQRSAERFGSFVLLVADLIGLLVLDPLACHDVLVHALRDKGSRRQSVRKRVVFRRKRKPKMLALADEFGLIGL